jgi:hypothetical protein
VRGLAAADRRRHAVAELDSIAGEAYAAATQSEPERALDAPPRR